jgi:uncharacterized membrane protein
VRGYDDAMSTPDEQLSDSQSAPETLVTVTTTVYILLAVGFLIPPVFLAAIIGVVINYVKRDDARGTFLESHFRWQIRTFWFGLLWMILGFLTWIILIGYVIHAVAWIWIAYRVIKGWLDLTNHKPMYRFG